MLKTAVLFLKQETFVSIITPFFHFICLRHFYPAATALHAREATAYRAVF